MGGDSLVEMTFAELVGGRENVIGGPFGSNLTSKDYVSSGVPIIRGSNMSKAGRYLGGEFAFVSSEKAATLAANQIEAGCLVVTQRGTLGQVSLVPHNGFAKYVVSQSQMGVRVRGADPLFVYYLLTSPAFTNFLSGAAIQTGVPHINLGVLRDWRVRIPAFRDQRDISTLLGALDDKIELNHRRAETLEAMARALFRSWFVDFDPIRAKVEGQASGLPEDLSALFPESIGDMGLPTGWNLSVAGEMFDISGGNTPSTTVPENWGGSHSWATPKDLSGLACPVLLDTERNITDVGLSRSTSGLLPPGSLLLSSRAPIGYMAFASQPVAINQGFAGFVSRGVSTAYAWGWCSENMLLIQASASGSTFPEISKSALRRLPMLQPSEAILSAFDAAVSPMIKGLVAATTQSRTLAILRDTLLPKLITGELRIRDAERKIAAA